MRINKFLADAGICSRRAADALVGSGRVSVNGVRVTTPGVRVDGEADRVEVDGRPVRPSVLAPCCIMLHKPVRVVSTVSDPQGRRTVIDCVPDALRRVGSATRRLYPVGRLDYFSEGLILVTDDGVLTERLVRPRHEVAKTYLVTVRGMASEVVLDRMRRGMSLAEGERLAPVDVDVLRRERDACLLRMVLRQGINRQIRRMCRDVDLTVLRLVRIAEGPLELGDLPCGAARLLTGPELAALRGSVGLA